MSELLTTWLEPLAAIYDHPDVSELRMRQPGVVIVERRSEGKRLEEVKAPEVDHHYLSVLCQALANARGIRFDIDEYPNVSTTLPEGHRFECLFGKSVASGLSLAIRCKHPHKISLYDMGLDDYLIEYVRDLLHRQANVVISGSTYTGKTTLLNTLLSFLPDDRRVVSMEDTPELEVERFWNGTSLLASREKAQGLGTRTWQQLYDHLMRISPDNIIFGEISTENAFAALNVLNTGARGWLCTVHAESPERVPERFAANIQQAGQTFPDVRGFMQNLVDVIIQIKRDPHTGTRAISDIWEMKTNRYLLKNGVQQ